MDILIGSDNKCRLKVKDLTKDSEYSYLLGVSFSRADSKTIDVLTYNKVSGEKTITPQISDNTEDTVYLDIPEDGWITLSHIVLPSKEWIEKNEQHFVSRPETIYIYCADEESIYRYLKGTFYEVPTDVIVAQNEVNTTLSKVEKDYVSICFLKQCYVDICQQIFSKLCGLGGQCFSTNMDKELSIKRDLVWMGINVIRYMVQFSMLAEAERIIEQLESCHGICSGNPSSKKSSGCGCSKK